VNVRTKLRGAFAIYIALLAGLSLYHVRTTRRAVASAREITEIAQRWRTTTAVLLGQLSEIGDNAQKAVIRHDSTYVSKAQLGIEAFDAGLRGIDSLPLTDRERALIKHLFVDWNRAEALARDIPIAPANDKRDSVFRAQLAEALDVVRDRTQELAGASEDAMNTELAVSDETELEAERATLLAAIGAVLLSIVLSALLARSILSPLNLLAEGTREVTAGRFNHRLTPSGNDELARVAREFNVMTQRLDELDRMKQDFVSKVSHDLKTPLSSMQETTAVMLDEVPGPLTAKQRQLLLINQESGQRLSGMITKLLDLSRIEAGLETESRVVDPRELVQRAVDHLVQGSSAERVSLTMSDAEPKQVIRGDPDALSQVFDNLLDNALKFSPFDGTVAVSVTDLSSRGDVPPDHWAALRRRGLNASAVHVTVADEGPGIADDDKERVFERFYQTDAGRAARSRGVGLGLAICREIVTTHGGAIWVSDNEPRGSIFHVLLPGASGNERPAPRPLRVTGASKR
jgi:two-component system sensor histidine kinase GlrK